ncbi:MAG: UPF0755 protein [Kiritimatiellia bacterium]
MNKPILLCLVLTATACANPNAVVDANDATPIVFEVPKGASGRAVGKKLEAEGLVGSAFNWDMSLRQLDATCIKAGGHSVTKAMTINELLRELCDAPIADDTPFTVLEGWRIQDIDKALTAKGWIDAGEYQAIATSKAVDTTFDITSPTLEGYLFPETYMVPPSKDRFSAKRLIERQLATFEQRFLKDHRAELGERSLHQVVIVASMVEREEPTPKYRPVVAGIMWKRLDYNTPLGIDATSRYELAVWEDNKSFLKVLKDPDHVYGTRVRKGLPPTAIGNPSTTSLDAALNAEKTEYWYYLHDSKGVFHGGRNAVEHEANRKTYNVY